MFVPTNHNHIESPERIRLGFGKQAAFFRLVESFDVVQRQHSWLSEPFAEQRRCFAFETNFIEGTGVFVHLLPKTVHCIGESPDLGCQCSDRRSEFLDSSFGPSLSFGEFFDSSFGPSLSFGEFFDSSFGPSLSFGEFFDSSFGPSLSFGEFLDSSFGPSLSFGEFFDSSFGPSLSFGEFLDSSFGPSLSFGEFFDPSFGPSLSFGEFFDSSFSPSLSFGEFFDPSFGPSLSFGEFLDDLRQSIKFVPENQRPQLCSPLRLRCQKSNQVLQIIDRKRHAQSLADRNEPLSPV